jgi:CTD small phosphatase-like protein 2
MLKDILIIDNSCLSFAFNIDNGIPIVPFYDDNNDQELKHLT